MKTFTRTIIVILALTMLTAGIVSAGNGSGEEIQAAEQRYKAELEQQARAEAATAFAQAQASQVNPPVPLPATPPPTPAPAPTLPNLQALNNNIHTLTSGFSSLGLRAGSSATVLVIPSEQTKTEDLLAINEDMSVMSRIFEKNIGQARTTTGYGSMFGSRNDSLLMFMGGRSGIQSLYLQGFGALFLMKVDFPLSPSPGAQNDENETQKSDEGDPVWQEMRREIYEPGNVRTRRRTDRQEEKYDAQKVENLKTALIQALKHASNIRSLKPDESVILTVTGSSEVAGTMITSSRVPGGNQVLVTERDAYGKTTTKIVQGTSLDSIGSSSPAILVIRSKKSDIDELAKGDLDLDTFRQRVQIFTYPLLGGAI